MPCRAARSRTWPGRRRRGRRAAGRPATSCCWPAPRRCRCPRCAAAPRRRSRGSRCWSASVSRTAATGTQRKRLALAAAIMGSFVAGLDATVVNVALPAIGRDLGGGLAGQQWVSNAYLLTLGSLILVAGSLADLYGERRVFSVGVPGFGVVSLLF